MTITAYDVQKIKVGYLENKENLELLDKFNIMYSINLYLNFINIFIYILKIISKKK